LPQGQTTRRGGIDGARARGKLQGQVQKEGSLVSFSRELCVEKGGGKQGGMSVISEKERKALAPL